MLKKSLLLITFCLSAFTTTTYAQTEKKPEFHDVDPRNTQIGVGVKATQNGELVLTSNGGFTNLYGGGEYQTQLVFMAEYGTQSNAARLRLANFDGRFGGAYLDIDLEDIVDMYTIGYMVPLQAVDSKLLFFPSINYTYVDFNTLEAADALIQNYDNPITIDGFDYGKEVIAKIIERLALKGKDTSSLGSLNIYTLAPWNETHYSLLQATAGSSYSGFDMEMVDVYFQQGMRSTLGKNTVMVFVEAEYTQVKMQGVESNDTLVSFGITVKF